MNRRQFLRDLGLLAATLSGCSPFGHGRLSLHLEPEAPWRDRFRCPQISWARVAPMAPTRGLVVARLTDAPQLHAWDVPTGALRPLTDRPDGVWDGRLAPNGRYVYYLADRQGDEMGHLVRVPFQGGDPVDLTPDLPAYTSWGCSISRRGNRLAFTAATRGRHELYALDLGPGDAVGAPRSLHKSRDAFGVPAVCTDGTLVAVSSTARTGKRQPGILAFEAETGRQVAELWDGPDTSLWPLFFVWRAGDECLLVSTNKSGVYRPAIWRVRSGKRLDLSLADLDGDVYAMDWTTVGNRLLLSQFHRAVQRLYVYHLDDGTLTPLDHPGGAFRAAAFRSRAEEIRAAWQDGTHPGRVIALDSTTGKYRQTILEAGTVPPSRPWRSVSYPSSDGREIQGWLAVPEGTGPFPAILAMHGGPNAVVQDEFDPGSQAWLDHGFAVLTVNYRGSSTFGRAFEEQIWGHPGDWELEDIVAARAWLVSQGIARPDRILLTGRSYGGYLTLLALGKRPTLWAGGMAQVAVADFTLMDEDASESIRAWQHTMLGGTPQEKPDLYRACSPMTYAEQVRAPILLIQGRHDTRTPARQAEAYVERMRALGKAIEVHWFEAGHLRADTARNIDHMERMLRFAARVL